MQDFKEEVLNTIYLLNFASLPTLFAEYPAPEHPMVLGAILTLIEEGQIHFDEDGCLRKAERASPAPPTCGCAPAEDPEEPAFPSRKIRDLSSYRTPLEDAYAKLVRKYNIAMQDLQAYEELTTNIETLIRDM